MIDVRDLIGKPYGTHGRGPVTYDCYGLAIEVCKRFGKELPDAFYESTSPEINGNLIGRAKPLLNASCIDEPVPGAVVVVMTGSNPVHIGVCLNSKDFIHCGKYGVKIERLTAWKRRIEGFYTWQ